MMAPEAGGKGVKYMGMNREESQDQPFSDLVVGRVSEECRNTLGGLGLRSRRQALLQSLSKYVCLEGSSAQSGLSTSWSFLEDKRTPSPLLLARLPLALSVHL